jgi:D-beta-D-heptose 7-phosphate kinase/D-beta-D-heptose 1-phosphate adenosyltransferase
MDDRKDADLVALVEALRPCRMAVVGDVMLDRYTRGKVDRLSPEGPIQVLEVQDDSAVLGGAANVAMKAIDLGAAVRLVGVVGDDEAGAEVRALLAGRRRDADALVSDPDRPTTVKTRLVAHNQQLLRVDRERRGPVTGMALEMLMERARDAAEWADAIILEDYGKGVLGPEVIAAVLDVAHERGVPVVVDPNGRDYRRYAGATVLTPNLREASIAADLPIETDADLEAAAARIVAETRGAALAVTRESAGISLFRRGDDGLSHVHVPTVPVAVFDVTGAGDAVAASLAIALASGIDLESSCAVANLAGRAVVRQLGVGVLSLGHLLDEAAERGGRSRKVVDLARAVARVAEVRAGGGKVVFTNGCFDILHYGHAFLLQYARSRGDFLVLGLNTDESIRRLKGSERPFVDADQRAYMLALYPFVDLIVLFDDDTPLALLEALRPDVLVKGGDYTPETVVGRELIEGSGGRVVICPRLDGLSTTDLVRKIQGRRIGLVA